MRYGVGISLILALSLSGCGAITRDLRHPGGYPGRILDKRAFDASESKQLQLLRFTIILAMAARMAGEAANDSKDADAIAEYLAATADEINYAAANIYPVNGKAPCSVGWGVPKAAVDPILASQLAAAVAQAQTAADMAETSAQRAEAAEADVKAALAGNPAITVGISQPQPPVDCRERGYYVNFEADVPLIELRMMRLLFATLPRDQIRKFAEDIQNGNFIGGAWNAIKVVFVGVKGLHTASGTYRSGQEVLVANLGADNRKTCSGLGNEYGRTVSFDDYDESMWTVKQAVQCLGVSADSLFGPHYQELRSNKLPLRVSPESFQAIFYTARTSCVRLPIGTADNDLQALKDARDRRAALCNKIKWNPQSRQDSIKLLP
ncbi:hypothetical protein [Sphingopyxis panaciterrae]